MTAKQLLDELRSIDFLLNYGPEEEKEAIDLIDKTINESEAPFDEIKRLRKALEAIRQDNVHTLDFSGHCVRCGDAEVSNCVRELIEKVLKGSAV